MKALIRLLTQRWFVSLLGLALVGALIWYGGPLVAVADFRPWGPVWSRVLTIALVVGAWLGQRVVRFLIARAANSRLIGAILGRTNEGAEPRLAPEAEQEVAMLKQRLEDALAVLRRERHAPLFGQQYLYQRPWYVLIGPPGSGKTTALTTSGLRFLVTDDKGQGQKVTGVHGTRNCDWFFTDQAVLLDTAGRYVTQDSRAAVDSAAWTGFLDLIKTYRKRRPINGVLVCVSLPDLIAQPPHRADQEARAIRLRIRELHERFGIRFPIYMVFTKCDLLPGFIEFFDDLGKEERDQVWGMTFDATTHEGDGTLARRFATQFQGLEQRINSRLTDRLQREQDPRRREIIYAFPQQFASVRPAIERLLEATFEPTQYEIPPMLRGVYFTSGTQLGTPVDRLMGALAASFRLDFGALAAFTGPGKSYFVTRLLKDVAFQEAGLANSDVGWERRRAQLQWGAYSGAAALAVLALVGWGASYVHNRALIDTVAQQTEAVRVQAERVPPQATALVATLPVLDAARNLPGGYGDRPALLAGFVQLGLDQRGKLGAEGMETYRRLLRSVFLPRLVLRLEAQMRDPQASLDALYDALRVYLMLNDPEHFDAQAIMVHMQADWASSLPPREREALAGHLAALFERGPVALPVDLDRALIDRTRLALSSMPIAERVYAQLMSDSALWRSVPDFSAGETVGRAFYFVFVSDRGTTQALGVKRQYTLDGYRTFAEAIEDRAEQLARQSWVLGEGWQVEAGGEALEQLQADIWQRYLDDYAKQWQAFLAAITLRPLDNDLNKGVEVAKALTSNPSPLTTLLEAVARETTLAGTDGTSGTVLSKTQAFVQNLQSRATDLFDGSSPVGAGPGTDAARYPVDAAFARLHELVRADEGAPLPIEETLALLAELEGFLKTVQNLKGADLVQQVKTLGDGVVGRVERHADRQPAPLERWLDVLVWQLSQVLGDRALTFLGEEWRSAVWTPYQRGLKGRYPLDRGSEREVTLDDFGDFFGPGGRVDTFFQTYLADVVETAGRTWALSGNSPLHLSREALLALKQAAIVREAFFARNEPRPGIEFTLKPITMDVSINHFLLEIDGQAVEYDFGPARVARVQWPGAGAGEQVSIRLSPPSASGASGLTLDGPWAWFRLLDRSHLTPGGAPERLEVTFDVDGRKAVFELRAHSALNPFALEELRRFECPETL